MEDLIERINNNIRIEKEKNIRIGEIRGKAEGKAEGEAKGKLENLLATIKNMLNFNLKDEEIIKYTNATQQQIDKVRKSLKK